jgi:hypothetical protein
VTQKQENITMTVEEKDTRKYTIFSRHVHGAFKTEPGIQGTHY